MLYAPPPPWAVSPLSEANGRTLLACSTISDPKHESDVVVLLGLVNPLSQCL